MTVSPTARHIRMGGIDALCQYMHDLEIRTGGKPPPVIADYGAGEESLLILLHTHFYL